MGMPQEGERRALAGRCANSPAKRLLQAQNYSLFLSYSKLILNRC